MPLLKTAVSKNNTSGSAQDLALPALAYVCVMIRNVLLQSSSWSENITNLLRLVGEF